MLKSIITEDADHRGQVQNAVETPNYLHLMMASNEKWVVPAALEARRFLVLLAAATKGRNLAWFKAIREEMENGGYEAMLHDLLHRDLTAFNVRGVPDTDGLQQQKKLSLGTDRAWWLECCTAATLPVPARPGAPFQPVAPGSQHRAAVCVLCRVRRAAAGAAHPAARDLRPPHDHPAERSPSG